jgi:hypothetical protein
MYGFAAKDLETYTLLQQASRSQAFESTRKKFHGFVPVSPGLALSAQAKFRINSFDVN